MNLLTTFILLYLVCTIIIGLVASRKVKKAEDFALAGRKLPFHLSLSAFFATWFGAETILGASAQFAEKGFKGIIEDPLGASLCLVLVGSLFVKHLYPKGYVSIGDFFRDRYGSGFELFSSLLQTISYFTYTSAQFVALALVMETIFPFSFFSCLIMGSSLVMIYTFFGGMWAVAITDFIQSIVIISGLLALAFFLGLDHRIGKIPFSALLRHQAHDFLPTSHFDDWARFFAAWMVMGLGSVPSQDVFQRIMSAKSEKIAKRSAIWAGLLYLLVALLPLYIVTLCLQKYGQLPSDTQQIIPQMVIRHAPMAIQALFFGALLSAILSTASASLLAQATVLGENLIKPYFKMKGDTQLLMTFRWMVLCVSFISLGIAFFYHDIFFLTSISSSIVLVTLFVPMALGIAWPSSPTLAAFIGALSGLCLYIVGYVQDWDLLAVFWGFVASLLGFVLTGVFMKKKPSLSFAVNSEGQKRD
jgi:Na+/proline symporter